MVAHAFNPSTREVEAGGSLVQGQPGLPAGGGIKETKGLGHLNKQVGKC